MELKCPQCGKWMAVSQEELVLHDCQIVCPQCLAICHYENGALVVKDDSDAPYRHNASVSTQPADSTKYCHSCGRKLPEGISFCPYCGVDLKTPFETEPEPAPAPAVKREEPVQQPVAPAPRQEERAPASRPVQDQPMPQTSQVEEKLRNIPQTGPARRSRSSPMPSSSCCSSCWPISSTRASPSSNPPSDARFPTPATPLADYSTPRQGTRLIH